MVFDDNLFGFDEIDRHWAAILVGNGASIAVSGTFAYNSLYDTAVSNSIAHPLPAAEQHLFDVLGTRNFERVLSALDTAKVVNDAFGNNSAAIEAAYDRIRTALIEAVHSVHIRFADIPPEVLTTIREALATYDFVYSSNYDLLIYWAIMQDPAQFVDYFFSGSLFDISNTEVWSKCTKFMFLHGGLHLYRTRAGGTYKRAAGMFGNLLDDFGTPIPDSDGASPLFVTEGNSQDKLGSIHTSDYLSFVYNHFTRNNGPLVIFGQTLAEEFDKHLIDAIRGSSNRVLAISIHPATTDSIAKKKSEWFTKFHNFDLHFFDSTTHPLGHLPPGGAAPTSTATPVI